MITIDIRRAAVLLIAVLLGTGCAPSARSSSPTPPPTPAAAPSSPGAGPIQPAALGAPLYLLNCSPCHGARGQGVDAPPLADNAYIQNADDPTLARTLATGFPGTEMPAWLRDNGGPFTQGQIQMVVAYLRTLQPAANVPGPTATPSDATTPPGDAGAGKVVFGTYCAVCHGPQGVQGLPNPGTDDGSVPALNPIDPEFAGASTAEFAANLADIVTHGSVPPGDQPLIVMPPFGDGLMLTDQQMADVIAYVIELNSGK
jgi:mono/diheme cytochrome c family protein